MKYFPNSGSPVNPTIIKVTPEMSREVMQSKFADKTFGPEILRKIIELRIES